MCKVWALRLLSVFEVQWSKDNRLKKKEKKEKEKTRRLQNIYACTSPPMYLWCWNKQAWCHMLAIVDAWTIMSDNQYLSPYQTRANVAALVAKKKQGLYIHYIGPWGPSYFNISGMHIYHCGCVDDQYLSPYETRDKWLPGLLRKSRPFIFKI